MKLRIRGNSIRLRLLQSEIAQLSATGAVSESINFGAKLSYSLVVARAEKITARFEQNEIVVTVPEDAAREWIETAEVSLTAEQSVNENETLKILLEKDFVCLERPDDADNRDAFPHPASNC